jgi:hypothetical protein
MISDDATSTTIGTSGNGRKTVIDATRGMRVATPSARDAKPGRNRRLTL